MASAMRKDFPPRRLARHRYLLGIDCHHDALIAEFFRGLLHKAAARDCCGIDRDFVGARTEQSANVLDSANPAADSQRHETGFGGAPYHVEHDAAILMTCSNVEKSQLIGAGLIVSD